ncbi:MAG: hypothetical protein FWD68_18030 [Alphaproteobacteria bacterium]|nr:hypothetical protein [Alphaproteobacteria bacterium]
MTKNDTVSVNGGALPVWPKDKILPIDRALPMAERVRLYQYNTRVIRASGCKVRFPLVDSLDPVVIEAWFREGDEVVDRIQRLISALAQLPDDTTINWL